MTQCASCFTAALKFDPLKKHPQVKWLSPMTAHNWTWLTCKLTIVEAALNTVYLLPAPLLFAFGQKGTEAGNHSFLVLQAQQAQSSIC